MAKTRALGIQIDTCYKCGGVFLDNGEFEIVRSKFVKRKKVVPVEYNPNSDIDIEEFYRDAQNEEIVNEYGIKKVSQMRISRISMRMLRFIFRLFL